MVNAINCSTSLTVLRWRVLLTKQLYQELLLPSIRTGIIRMPAIAMHRLSMGMGYWRLCNGYLRHKKDALYQTSDSYHMALQTGNGCIEQFAKKLGVNVDE